MSTKPAAPADKKQNENLGDTPRSDVTLPKQGRGNTARRSGQSQTSQAVLYDLPGLRDQRGEKKEEVFRKKLELCSIIFDFDDQEQDKRGKEVKRNTLLELVDFVGSTAGQKLFTEEHMPDIMNMVKANICRVLPPQNEDFDPEEDEPILEPSWPHLQVVYEFFLRFIVSSEVHAKVAKKFANQNFCLELIELFDSEDPRERDYLKTILHRIYGKFMSHRSFIRKTISNVFYNFVYETERHNGIAELLEILGSIINGYAVPLKKEHLNFLHRALIPLHIPKCVVVYHQQLSYCIVQYIEKDPSTAVEIMQGLIKYWPWSSSSKQVLFLSELEEILELLGDNELARVQDDLYNLLANCLASKHFQVAERTLFLWNNEQLVSQGCLSTNYISSYLPILYSPLYEKSGSHWNQTVESLARNVLSMYNEMDQETLQECTYNYATRRDELEAKKKETAEKWEKIEAMARQNTRNT